MKRLLAWGGWFMLGQVAAEIVVSVLLGLALSWLVYSVSVL